MGTYYRPATNEEIKRIKKGNLFYVRESNGALHVYEAADDARYSGRQWTVIVDAYTLDARTMTYVKNAARSFDNCSIVVDDYADEYNVKLYNATMLYQEPKIIPTKAVDSYIYSWKDRHPLEEHTHIIYAIKVFNNEGILEEVNLHCKFYDSDNEFDEKVKNIIEVYKKDGKEIEILAQHRKEES